MLSSYVKINFCVKTIRSHNPGLDQDGVDQTEKYNQIRKQYESRFKTSTLKNTELRTKVKSLQDELVLLKMRNEDAKSIGESELYHDPKINSMIESLSESKFG